MSVLVEVGSPFIPWRLETDYPGTSTLSMPCRHCILKREEVRQLYWRMPNVVVGYTENGCVVICADCVREA